MNQSDEQITDDLMDQYSDLLDDLGSEKQNDL